MRRRSEETRARLLVTFCSEAEEHLQAANTALASLRIDESGNGDSSAVLTLFRCVHTLKGAARSVGLLNVESLCQTLETLLRQITQGEVTLTSALLERLQESVDDVGRMVDGYLTRTPEAAAAEVPEGDAAIREGTVPGGGAAVAAAQDPPPATGADLLRPPYAGQVEAEEAARQSRKDGSIRVDAAHLDSLLLQLEDLLLPKLAAGQRVRELAALEDTLTGYSRAGGPAQSELRLVTTELRQIIRRLRADERRITRLHEQLEVEVLRLRTSPVSSVVDVLPRMVRDLAREAEKEIDLTLSGTELELDRRVLERIKDPLIHLVRNATDHGIEPPEVRERTGKPRRGRITLTFAPAENRRIAVSIQDDGAGVRLAEVQAAAARCRLLTAAEAETLSESEAVDLLFHSGFSTSPVVTRVSGHGLGLSIVRERVESIGGTLHLETSPGLGATVRMLLPATIATFAGLLVSSGGQPFLLPLSAVEQVVRILPTDLVSIEGRATMRRDGQYLPVAALHALLELPPAEQHSQHGRLLCVILASGADRLGILVDEVLGERELLSKELEPPLLHVPHVAGAGVLGSGGLVLILRPADLLRTALLSGPVASTHTDAPPRERAPVILVVDDSITTRMMEKNLLESAGYTVKTSVDGMEAWTFLKSEACDLVVSDVDMPRMDGFELTARIRGDAALRELPVILVTAMESREHRERGVLAGANAYVIKSSFEESNLLEIIHRLL